MGPLPRLPAPILSRRWQRINFIPTIGEKFIQAMEINNLYHEGSPEFMVGALRAPTINSAFAIVYL
ncbi:hypothetical protein OOK60_07950 [Trichothermofontia sichuanensis B231]|uniref:hypothetical protein n=1 Tax=Trichothermofontia sichuanensis TaxID=3045816 RepID=UPI0022460FD1|nr:hypothetical protein [Trichothermofontia sichuanensis]UZQ55981.1 hypothetical protein OOK60_07950 [Trichothermofontia sichuanensis B231]